MGKRRAQKPEAAPRPLQLDPRRATRTDRPPYAIVDIGSNSVRLLVYDQLGRAPMPRFNEKSLLRLADGLAETGVISPDGFRRAVQAVGRFRAIADAMGVSRIDAVATEAMRRAANGPKLAAAIEAECGLKVRILKGAEEARFSNSGRDLGILPAGRSCRRHGRRQPRSRGSDRRPCGRALGQSSAGRPAGRGHAAERPFGGQAPDRRDSAPKPAAGAHESGVLSGRGRLADARQSTHGGGRRASQSCPRLYDRRRRGARIRPRLVAAFSGEAGGDPRRNGTAGADAAGRRIGARPSPETSRARTGRLFRARPARGISLFPAQPERTISRSAGRGRAAHRFAARAGARFRARTRVVDR